MPFERYGKGIIKGLTVTLKHLFRPPITLQYPEDKLTPSQRLRGSEIIWYRDKCTGCATCAKSCPQGNIRIVTSAKLEENLYFVEEFEIDHGRSMFCGLCVESCPYDALFMGQSYERASYRRKELVLSNEQLQMSSERQPSGYARPKIEALLPKQTLLLDRIRGQKLTFFPLSRKGKR